MPMVIEIDGSSTVMTGSGMRVVGVGEGLADGDLRDAGDGDDVAGAGLSTGTRSSASVISSSVTLTRSVVPSVRHQATDWPLVMVPSWTRHSARRPR